MNFRKNIAKIIGWAWYPVKQNAIFFLFMYALGMVNAYADLAHWKGAEIYGNTWFELFWDLYILSWLLCIVPKSVAFRNKTISLRTWVKAVIYIFAYSLAIVDVFCFVQFGSTISPSILLLVGETTGSESAEFLSTYVTLDLFDTELLWVFIVLILHILVAVHSLFLNKKTKISQTKPHTAVASVFNMIKDYWHEHNIVIDAVFGVLVAVMLVVGWEDSYINKECMVRHFKCKTVGDVERDMNLSPKVAMYEPVYRLVDAFFTNHLVSLQLGRLKDEAEKIAKMTPQQLGIESDSARIANGASQNIVVIIGESYNKYHSQLYGYEKKTTPCQVKMERSGCLTKFTDVMAPWNLTSFVFKHLMTTYTVGDKGDWCDYPLFCQLFRKAGYQVNFLTNQFLPHAKDAIYDFSGGFFLNDETLSKEEFDVRNEETHLWDEDLIKDYDRLVASLPALSHREGAANALKGELTIFHLMGQHVNYRIRCPKNKMKFFTTDYDRPQNNPKEVKNIAYYDCAVWYNDSVVNAIVNKFRKQDAIIIYFPDHGDEVYGPGSLHHCGRNHTTHITKNIAEQEYEIPMWIYCTPKYAKTHPQVVEAIRKAKNKPFMTDAMSHLLLGLADIKTNDYRPQLDLLSPQYNPKRQRLMQHLVDYDKVKWNK